MRLLENKVAFITGGSSGIGKATAQLFAREGARVAALGRSREELAELRREIEAEKGAVLAVQADVSQPADLQRAVEETTRKWGRIDIVFANAGINGVWAPLEELEPEEWDRTIAINLKGTFLTVKYTVPWLKKQGGAILINSSVNGTRIFSNTGASAYSASKAGQVAFMKMICLELARSKIRVNAICPGAITTAINERTEKRDLEHLGIPVEFPEGEIPLTGRKPGIPEQVAQLALFLASDLADHISGTTVYIDGGQSLLQG